MTKRTNNLEKYNRERKRKALENQKPKADSYSEIRKTKAKIQKAKKKQAVKQSKPKRSYSIKSSSAISIKPKKIKQQKVKQVKVKPISTPKSKSSYKKVRKFEGKEYDKLTQSTKDTYRSRLNQLHKEHMTISEALNYTPKALSVKLGIAEETAKGYMRNYRQIRATKVRREKTVELSHKSHSNLGYTKKQMNDLELELTKTAGNSFTYLSDIIADSDKKFKKTRTKDDDTWIEANEKVKELLLLSESDRRKLAKPVQDLLDQFSP